MTATRGVGVYGYHYIQDTDPARVSLLRNILWSCSRFLLVFDVIYCGHVHTSLLVFLFGVIYSDHVHTSLLSWVLGPGSDPKRTHAHTH